jgi:GT2 family glycosyltransferase
MSDGHTSPIGIGVITYNRRVALTRTIAAIRKETSIPFSFVVADDGSTDGTVEYLVEQHIRYVGGQNRGIAWNKNRALFYLNAYCRCRTIILFEDDTFPTEAGWEQEWVRASHLWGHANIAVPWRSSHWSSGSGTAEDPYCSDFVSGQVSVFSAEALETVGYLDTRFKTYGYEHVEHTTRMIAAGFGGKEDPRQFFLLKGAVRVTSEPSFGTEELTSQNLAIAREIAAESRSFGSPWRNDGERKTLQVEMRAAVDRASNE